VNTVFEVPERRRCLREIANILSILECELIYEGELKRRDQWGWGTNGEWRKGEPL
jgi:hypothetical protein